MRKVIGGATPPPARTDNTGPARVVPDAGVAVPDFGYRRPPQNPTDYGSQPRSTGPASGDRQQPYSAAVRAQGQSASSGPYSFVEQRPDNRYGYQQNPGYSQFPTHPFGSVNDGVRGMGRTALGMVKMLPGIGNVANGIDFVNDLRRIGRAAKGDPNHSVLKSAADALFHGVGMLVPQVGGAYDMVQGGVRSTAAAFNPGNYMMGNYMMPPFGFYGGGFPMMMPGLFYW